MKDLQAKIQDKTLPPFERLVFLMQLLRSPEGCSWDRKQTHESLLPYLIEETYEVAELIESGKLGLLREELGDLLCQIVFHAQIASEHNEFDIDDSIECLIEKLIGRHPHVFSSRENLEPDQVRERWEEIKVESGEKKSTLSGLPTSMPALTMALRMGEKAGGRGFDWDNATDVLAKIDEELAELKEEILSSDDHSMDRIEDEIGDLLFAVSSLSRKLAINPELALKRALAKFRERFERLEAETHKRGEKISDCSLEQLEALWQSIKK